MSRTPVERHGFGNASDPRVILDLGLTHGGELDRARTLLEAADAGGAHAVQVPLHRTDFLISSQYAPDQARTYREAELSRDDYRTLEAAVSKTDLVLIPRVFDPGRLNWILERDPACLAFHHGDLTYKRLLTHVAGEEVPILLGVAGGDSEDIQRALTWLGPTADGTTLLNGPVHPETPWDVILGRTARLNRRFSRPPSLRVPISNESSGPGLGSLPLAACVCQPDPRSASSSEIIARGLRQVHEALRERAVEPESEPKQLNLNSPERQALDSVRRSLMAATPLPAGTRLEPEMVRELRPGGGLPADRIDECLGLRIARPTDPREMISLG